MRYACSAKPRRGGGTWPENCGLPSVTSAAIKDMKRQGLSLQAKSGADAWGSGD